MFTNINSRIANLRLEIKRRVTRYELYNFKQKTRKLKIVFRKFTFLKLPGSLKLLLDIHYFVIHPTLDNCPESTRLWNWRILGRFGRSKLGKKYENCMFPPLNSKLTNGRLSYLVSFSIVGGRTPFLGISSTKSIAHLNSQHLHFHYENCTFTTFYPRFCHFTAN